MLNTHAHLVYKKIIVQMAKFGQPCFVFLESKLVARFGDSGGFEGIYNLAKVTHRDAQIKSYSNWFALSKIITRLSESMTNQP